MATVVDCIGGERREEGKGRTTVVVGVSTGPVSMERRLGCLVSFTAGTGAVGGAPQAIVWPPLPVR